MGLYKPFQKQPWMLKRWVTREGMDIPPLIWLTISIPTMRLLKDARMSKTHIYTMCLPLHAWVNWGLYSNQAKWCQQIKSGNPWDFRWKKVSSWQWWLNIIEQTKRWPAQEAKLYYILYTIVPVSNCTMCGVTKKNIPFNWVDKNDGRSDSSWFWSLL